MISRRSVRIKTMQAIYAFERSEGTPVLHFETLLKKSINSVKEQYIFHLFLIREVANFVDKMAKIKASKYIRSEADKHFSTKLLSNIFINYLNHDKEFLDLTEMYHFQRHVNDDLIRKLYMQLSETELYQRYVQNPAEFEFEADKKIIKMLYEEVILNSEMVKSLFEEIWPTWEDDIAFVHSTVTEAIKKSKEELKLHLERANIMDKFQELMTFALELFKKTIDEKEKQIALYVPKLKNWEADRLAILDQIILRMALTEFTCFPSIPLKVSINEYLDISKEFSTPKSKDFINGVLDRLMKELKESGAIKKIGRGLINN